MEPEGWIGQQVSVYLDTRGSRETKAIGVLELIDDGGVVIEEDEEVIAYYPWRFILAIKVGEPEEPAQKRSTRRRPRERQIEAPEEELRRGPTGLRDRAEGLKAPRDQAVDPEVPQVQAVDLKAPKDQEGAKGAYPPAHSLFI